MAVSLDRRCRAPEVLDVRRLACGGALLVRELSNASGSSRATLVLCSHHVAEAKLAGWRLLGSAPADESH